MRVQLPDGTIGEFPDDMPQEQIESVLQQQFPTQAEASTHQAVPQSAEGLEPWQYAGGMVEGSLKKPGFLDTLDMINTGVHRGVTHFTLGMMSMLPMGNKYQNNLKKIDADIESEQQKNIKTYDSWAPQIGELGGELLATAPAGGALGLLSKGANALSSMAPAGLKTLARYGTSGVGGAGVLSGTEALRYQGDEFDYGKAAESFGEGMSSPLSYAAPMAGQALGRYLDKSRVYNKAVDEGIDVLPRDVGEKGLGKTLKNLVLDSFSTLTPLGRRAEQLQNIGGSIGTVIKKISGTDEAMSTSDLVGYASKNLQMGLKKLKAKGDILWEQGGFKNATVDNLDDILPEIEEAKKIISRVKLPTYGQTSALLDEALPGGNITFENIKNLGSILGDAASDAYNLGAGTGASIGNRLSSIRRNILDKASGNLSTEQLKAFKAAQAFSKNQFELEDSIPLIKDAISDQVQSNKIIEGILKDGITFDKSKAMGIMSTKGQLAVKAAKISQALGEASQPGNGVNLNTFLKKVSMPDNAAEATRSASATKSLLGDEYKHIEGLAKHLSAINEAKRMAGAGKFMAPLVGAGTIAGLGASGELNMENAQAIAPYAAMVLAGNHPVLKRLLGATTRKLSDSAYQHITNKVQDIFTRAGFLYNEDGSLSEKGDE